MKKILFPLLLTLLFFSCKTTSDLDKSDINSYTDEIENIISENTDLPETNETAEEQENESLLEDENKSEENSDINLYDDDEVIDVYEDLEPIEEPEIFDAPIEELEEENENNLQEQNENAEDITTPIEEEILPEILTEEEPVEEEIVVSDSEKNEIENIPEIIEAPESITSDIIVQVRENDDEVVEIVDEIEDENTETETENEEAESIFISRKISMKLGEYLDISYPGKGWVFLGSLDGSKNLSSQGRKIGQKDTNFTLLARSEGVSVLHFSKEDVLDGAYLDDYIEVTVLPERAKAKVHIRAPEYKADEIKKAKEAEKKRKEEAKKLQQAQENAENESAQTNNIPEETVPKTQSTPAKTSETNVAPAPVKQKNENPLDEILTSSNSETKTNQQISKITKEQQQVEEKLSAEELLKKAKSAFNEKNYNESFNNIQKFLSVAMDNRDEGLFILAQIYESNSPLRDIKKSIETYEQLKSNYPASDFWDDANKRSVYLQRFYINVR